MNYQIDRTHGCRISDSWTYKGLKTAIIENENLRIVVLIDKGADIYQFVHKPTDTDFLWKSPSGVRNPSKYVPTTGSGGHLWMDTYEGGWQTIFPSGGTPTVYLGADLGQHAEANTMPWDAQIIEDSPERVAIKFWVRTPRTPFYFEKTLSLESHSNVLKIDATLVNEGDHGVDCMWGEHIALGPPFLTENCIIDISDGTTFNHKPEIDPDNDLNIDAECNWPWTETKNGDPLNLSKVRAKSVGALNVSYFKDFSEGWYSVTNPQTGLGFAFVFPKDLFKYIWYWQSFGGGKGFPWWGRNYNIGLEPFTGHGHHGLTDAIKNGTAIHLKPRERLNASQMAIAYSDAKGVHTIKSDGTIIKKINPNNKS